MTKSILFIGAHPDDIEIGCLGTILNFLEKQYKVSLLIMSDGEEGGTRRIRLKELQKMRNFLKECKLFSGHLRDAHITHSKKTINVIENIIQKMKPNLIFSQSYKDSHQDHINVSLSTISATRQKSNLIFYYSPTSLPTFSPNLFIDITKRINKKLELLNNYQSQIIKKSINLNAIRSNNRYYGFLNNTGYCEIFEIFRLKLPFEVR